MSYAQYLRHNECSRTHNRRHDLSACRSNRLDRAGEMGFIAHFLHKRYRKGACGNDICRSAARYHPKETAGDNGHLGRAARLSAGNAHGSISQELTESRLREKHTKHDKQEYIA